jgi:dTDP-4-dehydrorhamnose reductase
MSGESTLDSVAAEGGVSRRVALTGSDGMLGQTVCDRTPAGYDLHAYSRGQLDVTNQAQLRGHLVATAPDIIINCAAYTDVDACEDSEAEATAVNGAGPASLAAVAKELGAVLVHISTDYVFDGRKRAPYVESDPTNPVSAYGRSKLAGERAVIDSALRSYFIVRTGWLYGPGRGNFVKTMLRLGAEREELRVVADQRGSPTYTVDLADAIFCLLDLTSSDRSSADQPNPYGIYHFSNEGECSWHEFAQTIIDEAWQRSMPLRVRRVTAIGTKDYPTPAKRPPYSVLEKSKYVESTRRSVPHWRDGLARYMETLGSKYSNPG